MTIAADGVSFEAPDSYVGRRDHGAWVLSGSDEQAHSTIAIKTSPNDAWAGDTGRGRPPDVVMAATEKVLKALPAARVESARERRHPRYRAFEVSASFVPVTKPGTSYVREQVVLFGEKRVIHVVLTHPASQPSDTDSFHQVVDSLREEG